MKKTKFLLPIIGLTTISAAVVPLVGCKDDKTKEYVVTLTMVGEGGHISTNTITLDKEYYWFDIRQHIEVETDKYYKFAGWFMNGEEVLDDTIINKECSIEARFIKDPEAKTIIRFASANEKGRVSKIEESFWSGFTFSEIVNDEKFAKATSLDTDYIWDKKWYLDESCTTPITSDKPIDEISSTIYANFIKDPEKFATINFTLGTGGVRFLSSDKTEVTIGEKWARVTKPTFQTSKNYALDGYYYGSHKLQPDDVIEQYMDVELRFKVTTNQDDFQISYNDSDDTASITSYPKDGSVEISENIIVPSYVYLGEHAYKVTTIGSSSLSPAFDISEIEAIELADGIQIIKGDAFGGSYNVAELILPDSITTIDAKLFNMNNEVIKDLYLGQNLKNVTGSVLKNMPNLDNFVISPYNTKFNDGSGSGGKNVLMEGSKVVAGTKDVILPTNATQINAAAFENMSFTNQEFTIPANISVINESAFRGSNVKNFVFAKNDLNKALTLNSWCFAECKNLEEMLLPDNRKTISIGNNVFQDDEKLPSFNVTANVTSLGTGDFDNCINLKEFTVDANNDKYTTGTNGKNCIVKKETSTEQSEIIYALSTIQFPTDVKILGKNLFYRSDIATINLPEGYTTIRQYAIYDCPKLTSITIPSTITSTTYNAIGGGSSTLLTKIDMSALGSDINVLKNWANNTFSLSNAVNGTIYLSKNIPDDDDNPSGRKAWINRLSQLGVYVSSGSSWTVEYK